MVTLSSDATPDVSRRDLTLDLARVAAVVFVVVVHLLQVGVGYGPDGGIVTSRPAESQPWFAAATWFGQIMPLFFVVGGFAAAAGWSSWTAKGGDAAGFVRSRVLRLAQPALPFFVFLAVVLGVASLLPIDPAIVDAAALGAGMPLWFLAAYLLCQAGVPLLARLHAVAPRRTLLALTAGVVLVDAARYSTGIEQVGLLNLLFVWPLVQQIGFWYHDGWFDRRRPSVLIAIAVAASVVLAGLLAWGPWAPDLLADLNPPTLPLVVLGVAQACVLRLVKAPLTRLMRTRVLRTVVWLVGSRLMTVYLWHLPVILVLSGLLLLIPGAAPAPASETWWVTRPLLFVATFAVVLALSALLVRVERIGRPRRTAATGPVAVGWICAFAPPFAVMEWGMSAAFAVGGALLLAASVGLLRWSKRTDEAEGTATGEARGR